MKTNYIVKYPKECWYDSTTSLHKSQVSRTCPRTRTVGHLKWPTIFTTISTISRLCALPASSRRFSVCSALFQIAPSINQQWRVCSTLGRIRGERCSFFRGKSWWAAALESLACLTVMSASVELIVGGGNDKFKLPEVCAWIVDWWRNGHCLLHDKSY